MLQVEKWKNIGALFFASLLLNFWAFYNRFPLVFPDTGTYLFSGFNNEPPADRPIFYGWFVRHLSLAESLYLALFFQALIMAYLIWLWVWYFGAKQYQRVQFLILVGILTFFTGASIQTSQLIPDSFASTSILAVGLLLFAKNLSRWHFWSSTVLLILSLVMHNSHNFILWSAFVLLAILWWKQKGAIRSKAVALKLGAVLACLLIAQFAIPTAHWLSGGGFVTSKASHVFLMNRMVDWGLVDQYLDDHCDTKDYKFCEYKDAIPRANFLWNFDESPLYKTGGWDANKEEYDEIIRNIVTSPRYWGQLILRSLEATMEQFFSYTVGDTTWKNGENSAPHAAIKAFFPEQERLYFWALQQREELEFSILDQHHRYLIGMALTLAVLIILGKNNYGGLRNLTLFVLVMLLANAAVCGILSGVFDRYQCRVVFVILLPLFFLVWNISPIENWIKKLSNYA
ncbi:MAG: hypothetical protein AAF798_19475 [Bacteroidota bacterium]